MINLVLVKKDMVHYVQDVKAVRGIEPGISDHHVVLCKIRLIGERWWLELGRLVARN